MNMLKISLFVVALYACTGVLHAANVRVWKEDPFRTNTRQSITEMSGAASSTIQMQGSGTMQRTPQAIPVDDNYAIQGIMKMGGSYRAMVANKMVKQGDSLDTFIVKKITRDKIIIQGPSGELRQVKFK